MEQHDDEQQDDLAAVPTMPAAIAVLPDDVLADVFRRVASPRGLAASRCVCRAWRALIDDRRLLRADLLPLSLPGLLLCLNVLGDSGEHHGLFVRPGAGADVAGHQMPRYNFVIDDHCNGLILTYDEVLNPATGRLVCLPDCPPLWSDCFLEDRYLAFDPAESPDHYQVLCVPTALTSPAHKAEPGYRAISQSEWPPSPFVLSVFSSVTGRWEARSLVRQGGAAGTVDDMDSPSLYQHSACWRGALYVHWQNDFVLRIPLSDHTTTYQVIKPPRERVEEGSRGGGHLGRSENGVYFASFDRKRHLCVWILQDSSSCDHMEWILKHRSASGLDVPSSPRSSWTLHTAIQSSRSSWTLHTAIQSEDGNADAQEWDSDDDSETTLHTKAGDMVQERFHYFRILALHPYREIVFIGVQARYLDRGLAYHLKSSKLEDLGSLLPKNGTRIFGGCVDLTEKAFPHTPCGMGAP